MEKAAEATIGDSMISGFIYRAVRWALAVVFLFAGGVKLINPESFAVIIEAYGLIPESWVMPTAVILPLLEVIAAVGLIFDVKGSLGTITGLLILFMAILGYGIWMGLDVDCGCFGPDDPEGEAFSSIRPALYRDMVMMAGVIFLYGWRYVKSIEPCRVTFIRRFLQAF